MIRLFPLTLLLVASTGCVRPVPPESSAAGATAPVEGVDYHLVDLKGAEVRPKRRVQPKYPAQALSRGLRGVCKVRIHIDPEGTPTHVEIGDCPPPFVRSVEAAAMQWRFHPTIVDGTASVVVFDTSFAFHPR